MAGCLGFVQANQLTGVNRSLICAGQTSVDENGSPLNAGDMKAQLTKCLDNLETVLAEGGFKLADVARLNYYTTDVNEFLEAAESVLGGRFAESGCRPASTLLGVSGLFHPDIVVELEATALA